MLFRSLNREFSSCTDARQVIDTTLEFLKKNIDFQIYIYLDEGDKNKPYMISSLPDESETEPDRAVVYYNRKAFYDKFPRMRERKYQAAGTLSGGEQQMLAMGRAIMSRPKLLILDEPSMGLSPIFVKEIFDAVDRKSVV